MMKITLKSIKHRLHAEWKPWVLKHWRLVMKITLQSIIHCWYAEWKPWLLKCWRLVMKVLKSIEHWHEKMKKLLVKYRNSSLFIAAILGAGLAFFIYDVFGELGNKTLQSSITILALGLPTFYVLWVFRTHDVQEQIDKTEENTNNSTFFECERMLTERKPTGVKPTQHDSLSKKTALEQLAYIRKTGFDEKRIDSLTKGLNLSMEVFNSARFSGLDLSKADLANAELNGADLTETKLEGTNLTEAELNDANLANAELNDANLANAELNGEVILIGAIYDSKTKFTGTILESKEIRDKAGMIDRSDELV